MKLRAKVLLGSIGTTVAALLTLGTILATALWENINRQVELRAQAFLAALAVASTGPLSTGRIDELDSLLHALLESNLEVLDLDFAAVLDSDGRVVGHTDQAQYGQRPSSPFLERAKASSEIVMEATKERLLVARPIVTRVPGYPGIRWGTAVVGVATGPIKSEILKVLLRASITIIVIVVMAALLLSFSLQHQVLNPLKGLTKAAQEFASGNMAARIPLAPGQKSPDEVQALAHTFNRMAGQIALHTEQLEERIRQRTRELEEANRKLEEMARTDVLTGLFNRRTFDEQLRLEIMRSKRSGLPLSLLMLDVDHFKHYNDTHGHQAGDKVLREIGQILKQRLRATDYPCRYGGEEFAVILPDVPYEDALKLAEEVRLLVEAHPFDHEETQPGGKLTVSIGVATYPGHGRDEASLIEAADRALYLAKERGRNRVCGASLFPPSSP